MRRVVTRIAQRFVSDTPPASLVARLSTAYLAGRTSIAGVLRVLFGSREFAQSTGQKWARPQEYQAAAYAAERARVDLERLRSEAERLIRERDALARAEDAFDEALTEFSQAVDADADATLDTRSLRENARRRLDDRQRRREADEALAAGRFALDRLNEARMELGSADSWSAWDTWGGGDIISSMMKHRRLDQATDRLRDASAALEVFSRELGDVHADLPGLTAPMVDGLSRGLDIWFDNFFTDLMVRDRIKNAMRRVEESIRSVEDAIDAVERVRSGLQDL